MKTSVIVLATFDYELFLGSDSGTVDACLLRPTDLLLDRLATLGICAIFFVDTIYLLRLREAAKSSAMAKHDYERICEQLGRMGREGHDVFPHLHPHWVDAEFSPDANRWSLQNYRYYSFASCPPKLREELIEASIELLQELLDKNLRWPLGYRAGGWCIQPFGEFLPMFEKWNIIADFSVVPGRKSCNEFAKYDFNNISNETPYCYSNDVCKHDPNGALIEYPISMIASSHLDNILHDLTSRLFWHLGSGRMLGDGKGVLLDPVQTKPTCIGGNVKEMASLDHFSLGKIPSYVRSARSLGFLHLCSHPKILSRHGLWAFSKLIDVLRMQSNINSDWRSFLP